MITKSAFAAFVALMTFAWAAVAQEQEPAPTSILNLSRSGTCANYAAGSCFQLNTQPPVTILIGTPSGGDGGGEVTPPEPPPPPPPPPEPPPPTAKCPADDGSANARAGTPQHPTLLNRYDPSRTIRALGCKVAGVDYYVGPTGTLSPPSAQSITDPNIVIAGTLVRCNTANADARIDNVDFTGFAIYIPPTGCRSLTVTNARFGCAVGQTGFAFVNIQGSAAFTLRHARVDTLTNCNQTRGQNVSDPITCASQGACTIEYVWFWRLSERAVTSGCGAVTYRYSLLDDLRPVRDAHQNYLQQGCAAGGTQRGITVQFNTTYQAVLNGAEGFQFNAHANQIYTINGPVSLEYNTMIALPVNGAPTMSNIIHGFCHTAPNCNQTAIRQTSGTTRMANNFFDPSGAFNAFYPGMGTAMWPAAVQFDNNVNMNNGSMLRPN